MKRLALEFQLLADVGLVGLPNVGKSTLLARISNARPKIGNFPFTTLQPSLGIVAVGEARQSRHGRYPRPGRGGARGTGLGDQFLRHIERTRLLLFLIDCLAEDPAADYRLLLAELAAFSAPLARRPRVVVFSRGDLKGPDWVPPDRRRGDPRHLLAVGAGNPRVAPSAPRQGHDRTRRRGCFAGRCRYGLSRTPVCVARRPGGGAWRSSVARAVDRGPHRGGRGRARPWMMLFSCNAAPAGSVGRSGTRSAPRCWRS